MTTDSLNLVRLPPLLPIQKIVHDDQHRFKVLVMGRRGGKSFYARLECLDRAINFGQTVWFVSPTYNNVMTHWRAAKRMVGDLATYKNEQQKYLEFEYGGRVGSLSFKSADSPDNLRGEGLDYVVVDEAAYQDADVWFEVLRPSLSDKRGGALLISTPNGVTNWFYQMYVFGQDPEQIEWASWRFPSSANPNMTKDEVASAESTMPELKFKQEYLAEFVSDAGGVFRNVENAAVLKALDEPVPGDLYYAGLDWGRKNDFTVISIFNHRGDQVYLDRFSQIGWQVQRDRVVTAYKKWNIVKFFAEANAAGSANIEALQAEGLPIEPIYMTNPVKTALIERYAANIERGNVRLLSSKERFGEQQVGEMQAYTIQRTKGGTQITYNAAKGWHDDTVIGGALGASIIHTAATETQMQIVENPFYRGVVKRAIPSEMLYED